MFGVLWILVILQLDLCLGPVCPTRSSVDIILQAYDKRVAALRTGPPAPDRLTVYNVDAIGRPGTPRLTRAQLHEVHRIISDVKPQYRRFIRFLFFGPRRRLAVFVSRNPTPPDYGPESYVLNECHPVHMPNCHFVCTSEIKYSLGGVVPLGPQASNCVDGEMFFLRKH